MNENDNKLPQNTALESGNVLALFKNISAFIFDVDGVLTNGNILVLPGGIMARQMNIKDGYALQLAAKKKL